MNYTPPTLGQSEQTGQSADKQPQNISQLPPQAQEKMKQIIHTATTFKDKLLERFGANISAVTVLPPGQFISDVAEGVEPKEEEVKKEHINILVLVDDTDSTKISKAELVQKLSQAIEQLAKQVDEKIIAQTIIYSELWQYCFDSKTGVLGLVASSYVIHDTGMLAAIKVSEVHKAMVLKKFEKYIVSYVLGGSLVQGKATATSDIDVFIVIDDTDVKKMTRVELKDRLRSIIISLSYEASKITGVTNKMNIQTYILTDFWENIKEANPVIFTFLRDGVPFYDRGIFMPWKQLLRMGKIRPSMEAIDMYMASGEQMLERIKFKLSEVGMEDTYWAILNPAQAALMLYGLAPPTPRETPELLRKIFVKKEKMLEEKYVKILENNIKIRKELEHGTLKKITGAQIDELVSNAEEYLQRIKQLFTDISEKQQKQGIVFVYDQVITLVREILVLFGVKQLPEQKIIGYFEEHIIHRGAGSQKLKTMLEQLVKAKADYDADTLSKSEVEKVIVQSQELLRELVDILQRKKHMDFERMRVKILCAQDRVAEIFVADTVAYVNHNVQQSAVLSKIDLSGKTPKVSSVTLSEFDTALSQIKSPGAVFITEQLFAELQKILGKDIKLVYN
jgi:uncharacterized protein (UPF0332 family)/predicted nucleotidyltransferase